MSRNWMMCVKMLSIIMLVASATLPHTALAILPQQNKAWYWTSDTNIKAVAASDVNADGVTDIITGGYYNDGTKWQAQLAVWNGATMAVEAIQAWFWIDNTQISSVAVGDVNADGVVDVVTGGSYFDGTRWVAQLAVWNAVTLAFENVHVWYWTGDTQISSVAVGDVNADGNVEIVTGGTYFDGTRYVAQLIIWDGTTLSPVNYKVWYWNANTIITSLKIAAVGVDTAVSIITGGSYFDGTRNQAQLIVWDSTLAVKSWAIWYWTGNTEINSVSTGDVNGDGAVEVLTGGKYFDSLRDNAQLVAWNGATLTALWVKTWYWTSTTQINSVSFGDVTGDAVADIVTGGSFYDGNRNNAQIVVWNGPTYAQNTGSTWYWVSSTWVESIAINTAGTASNSVIAGGNFYDNTRDVALLSVWG